MAVLNDIANRLTPSVPLEITFGAGPIAGGKKFTTIYGHMAASPGSGTPYQVYQVINVGDPASAQAEVDALAGSGSQIGKMAFAFVNANVLGGFGNFPGFRVVLLPFAETAFGPNQEGINAVKFLRSDMFVSCYPASDSTNRTTLLNLVTLISGIDRDLTGQFGSFMTVGSLDVLATAVAYNINSRYVMVAYLQDTNTASGSFTGTVTSGSAIITAIVSIAETPTGDTTSGSAVLTNVSSTAGIYPGATITGTGIPVSTTVEAVTTNTITISNNATATATSISFTVTNVPATAGIYPGATLSGTGIPANTTVLSVAKTTITMTQPAASTGSSESISYVNQVSQPPEILAAIHAANVMGSGFPYNPMQGVIAGGAKSPQKTSDWIAIDPNGASEAALAGGLSPLYVQPGGTVGFIRTRTTYVLNGLIPVSSYFDWQDLVTLNDFREDVFTITQSPPFNGNPGGTKASSTIAALLKDEVLRQAQFYEDQGAFQGVQSLAPQFIVQPSQTSRGRFDFKIPVNVLPGLFVIAGNIQATTQFDFTL